MIEVSLSSELTNLFYAYYVGDLEVYNTLYYNFDMSAPMLQGQTLYTTDEMVIVTNFDGTIDSIT